MQLVYRNNKHLPGALRTIYLSRGVILPSSLSKTSDKLQCPRDKEVRKIIVFVGATGMPSADLLGRR